LDSILYFLKNFGDRVAAETLLLIKKIKFGYRVSREVNYVKNFDVNIMSCMVNVYHTICNTYIESHSVSITYKNQLILL